MSTANHPPFGKLSSPICIVFVFLVAAAIASPAQTFTNLVNFTVANGANPDSGLTQGADGNFYGTTPAGGPGTSQAGTVFKVSSSGTLTTLYTFCSQPNCADGGTPTSGLVRGSDGNFYGTTAGGGASYDGTVFTITPAGALTTLYSFQCSDGNCPNGSEPNGLVLSTDGNFYGTTQNGGATSWGCCGTVFKITPSGTLTTIYTFSTQGNDGVNPAAALVQGADGNFYGTTTGSNLTGGGTVFKITPGGTLTTLYTFCNLVNCMDGRAPVAALVEGMDANFYGTTEAGGRATNCNSWNYIGCGTVFKITPGGALTTLYSFCSQSQCTDGWAPLAALVQGTDGNLYGTTGQGGTYTNCPAYCGTIFKLTPAGSLTTLHSFDGTHNDLPRGALVQGSDGIFYGTTSQGGYFNNSWCTTYGCGTVFSLAVSLSPFVETQPTSGPAGAPVTIFGTNLTGSTSVTFNGTAAAFNVVSASEITTTVPVGATTGTVQVATEGGVLTSNTDFQVTGPLQLVPVTPCRLVDTRQTGGPIQGGTSRSFTVPQLGNCSIPASAAAYSLNITVVPHGPLGYLTIWPEGEIQPYVSTMNSVDGRTKANAAIVPAGNNAVSVYVDEHHRRHPRYRRLFCTGGLQRACSSIP